MIDEFAATLGMNIFQLSVFIIILAVIIVAISIMVNVFVSRKSSEETVATKVLKNIKLIEKGKLKPKTIEKNNKEEKVVLIQKANVKTEGVSLKEHLAEKFKPKIEKQLKTKIKLLDFNGKGDQFNALVEVGEVKVLLVLDASGKIIDYKKK